MIRTNDLPGFTIPASVIGFGCASLGSRIAPAQGLRALEEAHAAGVNWFDLAPAYGAGDAERVFARFAAGKRDRILVCSKVGLAPPRRNALLKVAYGIARPIVGAAKGVRRAFRRVPSTRNVHVPLSAEGIMHSLDASLSRIGTDYLDLFVLHKPATEDVGREDVLATLARILKSGRARQVGVSGDLAAALQAARHPEVYGVVQLADEPWSKPLEALHVAAPALTAVTHSVLGLDGSLDRLASQISAGGERALERLRAAGYGGAVPDAVGRLLVDRALAANARGVVLLSMFGAKHRAANIESASRPSRLDTLDLVDGLIANGPFGVQGR